MKARKLRLTYPTAYYQGRASRQDGKCRLSQPFGNMTVDGGWWLVGWHDVDMELTHETQTNGPAAPPAPGTDSLAA